MGRNGNFGGGGGNFRGPPPAAMRKGPPPCAATRRQSEVKNLVKQQRIVENLVLQRDVENERRTEELQEHWRRRQAVILLRREAELNDQERERIFRQVYGHLESVTLTLDMYAEPLLACVFTFIIWHCMHWILPILPEAKSATLSMLWSTVVHCVYWGSRFGAVFLVCRMTHRHWAPWLWHIYYYKQRNKLAHQSQICAVCLEDVSENCDEITAASAEELGGIKIMSCGHRFHVDCIEPWLKTRGHCPLCKAY